MATREVWSDGVLVGTEQIPDPDPGPPTIEEVFADVPVVSIEEANTTLLALKAALEARGMI